MSNIKRFDAGIDAKRIVIKVGTSSLTHPSGLLNIKKIEQLVKQLADLKNSGVEVILVSSGAIGAGMGRLKVDKAKSTLREKQALAAVGQNILMHMYFKMAAEYGFDVGQVLITREDIVDVERGANSKNVIEALLEMGVMPIINENDAVAVDEIKFGDNDRLSAMVAQLIDAQWLILLSDIDGLYDANPKEVKDAKLISHILGLSDEHRSFAGDSSTNLGTGGMTTKLMAVEIAQEKGIQTIIANSDQADVITKIMDGELIGTWFESEES
ncbi:MULTISPECIES: glutamate 5-kinase [unclassified Fusibacter]|uniref:glutamate 5-kinase n=1 Tax=unclassified Fusibacter TaxID=2624464 RepID=UPI001011955F|nr:MULTISPECIES: glutamate 5-kinase [unclassified Fusibacter]MCK8059784.1 glutamate 5-kinase [Fusibacter sp. A2]NPE21585.1 glutamate 5-kinase [Fusibacter sp. A1]RXV61992.1 glutamate 5-kinase [Fusibacter sp. A1]